MAMGAPTAMPTDTQILTLSQWLSPAYPVGSFAYSHGLETMVAQGWVADADDFANWLEGILRYGAGSSDALLLAAAYLASNIERVEEINATALAFAPSKERLSETLQQGEAFCRVTRAVWATELTGLAYPVALGRAAALQDLPLPLTSKLYLLAFLSNLVGAGQRLLPLGQTQAQAMIRNFGPLCVEIAQETQTGDLSRLSSSVFLSDIASMQHDVQKTRIFRT